MKPGMSLLLAVSGGCDSVALLRACAALAPRRQWNLDLHIAHVQHHLRDSAEADAAFVTDLAKTLNLPHLRTDLDLSNHAGNVEATARRERYAALQTMAQTAAAAAVVTAHHGDDQLETLLMRMLRGSSARGLSGIRWRRRLLRGGDIVLLRPMLATDRAMARDYLSAIGQAWCEDPTNEDTTRRRARLRRDVLPILREMQPNAASKAVHMADHMAGASRVIEAAVDRAAAGVSREGGAFTMDRAKARQWNRLVLAGVLRRLLGDVGVPTDALGGRAVGPIVRAVRDREGGERRFALSGGVTVTVNRHMVRIAG